MAKPKTVAGTGADPTIKFAMIKIDGESYKLAFNFNAIAEAEAATGINLIQGFSSFFRNDWSASQLRALFYASLRIGQPNMTLNDVGRLLRLDLIPEVFEAILEAYQLAQPEKKAETVEPLAEAS